MYTSKGFLYNDAPAKSETMLTNIEPLPVQVQIDDLWSAWGLYTWGKKYLPEHLSSGKPVILEGI